LVLNRGELRDEAKRLARASGSTATLPNSIFDQWLNEANIQLQRDTKWLHKKRTFYTREYFSVGIDEGFGIIFDTATGTIWLLGVCTAMTNVSGSVLATALQREWNSTHWGATTGAKAADTGIAVSYSTSTRKFTVTSQAATYTSTGIIILPPLYANSTGTLGVNDLTYKLFGITGQQDSASTYAYTGNEAPYCMSEYPLPGDFFQVKEIRYDDSLHPLRRIAYKGRDTGTGIPQYYYTTTTHFGLVPEPTDGGKIIELDYYYLPDSIATGAANDTTEYEYPNEYDYALIYWAMYLYYQSISDQERMMMAYANYDKMKIAMKQDKEARGGSPIDIFSGGRYRQGKDPRRYSF
jgi:hypothetical protein